MVRLWPDKKQPQLSLTSRIKIIYTVIKLKSKRVKDNIHNICFPSQNVYLVKR